MPYYITQRGNYGQAVFVNEHEYMWYCFLINYYATKYGVDIHSYCLMPNHVHFIAIPHKESSFASLFRVVHMRYAQYVHQKRMIQGHFWQGRFFSKLLNENHMYRAIRYVETNPCRARIIDMPWDYEWSSAGEHCGIKPKNYSIRICDSLQIMSSERWREFLSGADPDIKQHM